MGDFWGSIGNSLSSVGSSIGSSFAKDGWLNEAFKGANFGTTMKGGASLFDAYSGYKAANAKEDFDNKIFGLQEEQYRNSLADQEEEKKRRDLVDTKLADVWG